MTQAQMAELLGTTKQSVSLRLRKILSDEELAKESVVKESLMTAADGKAYHTKLYSLDAILEVGYRVRSLLLPVGRAEGGVDVQDMAGTRQP